MANVNPWQARVARAEKRRETLLPVVDVLADALNKAREHMDNEDATISLRAANAVAQVAGAFIKAYEAAELLARIEALEASQEKEQAQRLMPNGTASGN